MLKDLYNTLANEVHELDETELAQVSGGVSDADSSDGDGSANGGDKGTGPFGGDGGSNTGASD